MIRRELILACLILLSFRGTANDVVITVTGRVVPLPCNVDTTQLNLDLGKIYASALSKAGSFGAWVNGTIKLSNCPTVTSGITASFSGQPGSVFYKNNGTAQNVDIQLQSSGGVDLSDGKTQKISITQMRTGEPPLRVRVYSQQGNATDGTIRGTINVIYTYQ